MTFYEEAEKKRDALVAAVAQGKSQSAAVKVFTDELNRLLLLWNDGCDSPRGQETAQFLVSGLTAALPMMDTVGEIQVWERRITGGTGELAVSSSIEVGSANPFRAAAKKHGRGEDAAAQRSKAGIFALAGIVCAGIGIGTAALWESHHLGQIGLLIVLLCTASGLFLLWMSGRSGRRLYALPKENSEQQFEAHVDAEGAVRMFLAMLRTIDRSLEEAQSNERWEKAQAAGETQVLSPQELTLYAGLLEAACSNDGDYALEQAQEVKHFLHKKGVELVNYSPAERSRFDLLPGTGRATICPAIVYEGKTLRKGQATDGI